MEKTNLPVKAGDTVYIAGVGFEVEQTDNNLVPYEGSIMGLIDTMEQTIKLSTMPGFQIQQHVFIHEVIHGIIDAHHIPIDKDKMEDIVDTLARGLYQVLIENPEIILRYIYGVEEIEEIKEDKSTDEVHN